MTGLEGSFRAGIGTLEFERGPEELRMWTLRPPLDSALLATVVPVNILLEGTDDLDTANLGLIAEVIADPDRYLADALRFAHRELLDEPALFGLTEAEIEPYREVPVRSVPLGKPAFVFYTGADWCVFLEEGRLPICDPYGFSVAFADHRPVRIEDWRDAEIVG